jgi:hypothetical protein
VIGAGAWAWWAAARNQRAEGRGDPARTLQAPLLGEVPKLRDSRVSAGKPVTLPPALEPSAVDAYDFVVASLMHKLTGVGGRSVAMTSVGPGDWRTSVTLNIADAAWKQGRRVLLIDADERTRRLSELYGLSETVDEGQRARPVRPAQRVGRRRQLLHPAPRVHRQRHGAADQAERSRPGASIWLPSRSQRPRGLAGRRAAVRARADRHAGGARSLGLHISVAGQTDGIVLVVPHRVSLRELHNVRDHLAFVKTPLIGYIYVRPRGLGFRARRRRGRRRVRPEAEH